MAAEIINFIEDPVNRLRLLNKFSQREERARVMDLLKASPEQAPRVRRALESSPGDFEFRGLLVNILMFHESEESKGALLKVVSNNSEHVLVRQAAYRALKAYPKQSEYWSGLEYEQPVGGIGDEEAM